MLQSKPALVIPANATDCHVHVFGPRDRYAYAAARTYTPPDALFESLGAHCLALGLGRVVIVQPSPYGTDNACTLDAIARLGPVARGVAVIDAGGITDDALQALHRGGIRGVRANLQTTGVHDPEAAWSSLARLRDRIADLGWHLQTYTNLAVIDALHDKLATLGVPLVVDHFGGAKAALGLEQPGFGALLSLVGDGKAHVKLSAAYRVSTLPDAADVAPLAAALIAANADRMLWGSDWPHPGGTTRRGPLREAIEPFLVVDDGAALSRLAHWAGSDAMVTRILVDNPARLYGY